MLMRQHVCLHTWLLIDQSSNICRHAQTESKTNWPIIGSAVAKRLKQGGVVSQEGGGQTFLGHTIFRKFSKLFAITITFIPSHSNIFADYENNLPSQADICRVHDEWGVLHPSTPPSSYAPDHRSTMNMQGKGRFKGLSLWRKNFPKELQPLIQVNVLRGRYPFAFSLS
jgi:hypothetical protein